MRDSPIRARVRAGAAVTSRPNSSTVPALGGNSPEMRLNSVVFPAPFGPRIARRSPAPHGQVDVGDGDHAAEAPADPPKAEDRLGALGGCRDGGRHCPKETSSALPTHGGGSRFSHFGLLRSGAGLSALKNPPNV